MDRPTLKLEIPLPRRPSSPRLRFSLRTLIVAVSLIAAGLALYTRGRETERAHHLGGYFHLVVADQHGMEAGMRRCREFPSVLSLAQSYAGSVRRLHSDNDPKLMWPPKIWITRVDWDGDVSEETITVPCAGTPEAPTIDPTILIKNGDRVVFEFGKRRKSNVIPEGTEHDGDAFDRQL